MLISHPAGAGRQVMLVSQTDGVGSLVGPQC